MIYIGDLIRGRIEDLGMSKAEFGRRLGKSRQNVNDLLGRTDIGLSQLGEICEILDYDFFKHYTNDRHEGPASARSKVSLTIEIDPIRVPDILHRAFGEDVKNMILK